ncbi:MAG: AAA family ATPase [Planctomycetia bacterium]|nr:AAA family ATPase [Planctomycetia bacterium]
MLKSLDLYGFKSFADRNRFEFSAGLTVIVGPNGSGKSNVVDAIKWVLGEKSMKSLRGKESSDVIFSGSGTRKAMNTAEVSLSFDNSDQRLNFDASEVVVTRRVFRSGDGGAESEYFLNRQPCKLKDIRDLLLGTGLGTHAYSIIEQGRVDSLLQSSPRERRILFEEAAGISRFKAKKIEAMNRLERIDQNLTQLSRIVDEVSKQLSRVQNQAQRATQFRELTARLEELRFQATVMDYTSAREKATSAEDKIAELLTEKTLLTAKLETADSEMQQFEKSNTHFNRKIQELTDKIAVNRHAIGASESVVTYQTRRATELDGEINSGRMRIAEMRRRLRFLQDSRNTRNEELLQAQNQYTEVSENLTAAKQLLEEATCTQDELRARKETHQTRSFDLMREISGAENAINSLKLQEESISQQLEQNEARVKSILAELGASQKNQEEMERQLAELEALLTRCEEDLAEAQSEQESAERLWDDAKSHLMELHRRHSAMLGRISTLEELQERHEGLSPGVRYLLTEARRHADGPFRNITGLVADLIQVDVNAAPLIEVALGEQAQYLVVEPNSGLLEALRQNSQGFPGRVGFVWMEDFLPPTEIYGNSGFHGNNTHGNNIYGNNVHGAAQNAENSVFSRRVSTGRFAHVLITNALEKMPGVLGRADQFIQCPDVYLPLFKYLLGETWLVEDLTTAMDLSRQIYSGQLPLPLFPAVDFSNTENFTTSADFASMTNSINTADSASTMDSEAKQERTIHAFQSTAGFFPRVHFVTLGGERYSADGILCIGPHHASSNLISRRSELRTLGSQLTLLSDEISQADEDVQKTQQELSVQQQHADELEDVLTDTKQKLFDHRQGITAAQERQKQLTQRVEEFRENGRQIQNRLEALRVNLRKKEIEKGELETQATKVKTLMDDLDEEIVQSDALRSEKNRMVTECKVELAKSEERVESLRDTLRQLESDMGERNKIISEQQTQLNQNLKNFRESEWTILSNNARLSDIYMEQEGNAAKLAELRKERDSYHSHRSRLSDSSVLLRKQLQSLEEKVHVLELKKSTLDSDAENVVSRFCEDYDLKPEEFLRKIAELSEGEKPENEGVSRDVHKEIVQLRSKIQALGNINSEALNELDELQARYDLLDGHYQEILSAKEKLLKLIERVNEDSRKIFMKTFDRIGEYFFHIFRDLFGGGNAELQLSECEDPLDAGIEIIAQPPGKQRLNLSLMSGGEKTMTCVALLFALFKNHPSQFCILDEVDAALDEANTVRLTEILNQFRDQTQFIIISHSKKTMSVANTIYGVTMQDSGISKQVSVKFEEVTEDGELESLGIRLFPAEGDDSQSRAG